MEIIYSQLLPRTRLPSTYLADNPVRRFYDNELFDRNVLSVVRDYYEEVPVLFYVDSAAKKNKKGTTTPIVGFIAFKHMTIYYTPSLDGISKVVTASPHFQHAEHKRLNYCYDCKVYHSLNNIVKISVVSTEEAVKIREFSPIDSIDVTLILSCLAVWDVVLVESGIVDVSLTRIV